MLKRFFLNTLSSFMGAWIALILFGVVAVVVVTGLIAKIGFSNAGVNTEISKNSVMVLELNGPIIEREQPEELDYLSLMLGSSGGEVQTLQNLKRAIAAAKENKNVSGIYIKCNGASASPATLNALRDALLDFKESGKTMIAYSNDYSMGDYFIATVADKVYLNPFGNVTLKGIGGVVMYYKGLLDKIGVNMQVVKVGTYKSAVEPYILPEMSRPARAQLDTLYGNMWNIMRSSMASSRNLQPSLIDTLINHDYLSVRDGKFCLKNKLVDFLCYERSMDSIVASSIGVEKENLNYVSPRVLYTQENPMYDYEASEQIAVLFASGEIMDGAGSNYIDYEILVPVITELAENENIKGMVLRVNSPGGSAFGSAQIGEALDYFQSKGKPLAVSMGDYAASGGYWISCCADRIFADKLTITGSIGIFGLIPDVSPLLNKVGLSPQLVTTNPSAAFPTLVFPLTDDQHSAMQKMIESSYGDFVARVARGRHLSEQRVREIGEGRVWDAVKAKEIGLVDEFGGLQEAIEWVAQKGDIKNYGVPYYPTVEENFWSFVNQFGGMKFNEMVKQSLGNDYSLPLAAKLYYLVHNYPVQAKMPEMTVRFVDSFNSMSGFSSN